MDLIPVYRKVADREVNSVIKAIKLDIEMGAIQIGQPKKCEDVIRENLKEFKGIVKAVGYDSPNPKFKKILGLAPSSTKLAVAAPNSQLGSQAQLSLMQLQQKENKSIFTIQSQKHE